MGDSNKLLNRLSADILTLDYDSLVKLNRKVVERLKALQKVKHSFEIMQFELYDRVSFLNNGKKMRGIVTRVNQRSIRVVSEEDPTDNWLVAPSLLTKVRHGKSSFSNFLRINNDRA
jgi:hypothetical protein